MNNIIYDDEITIPEDNIHDYYRRFTKKLNGRDCVKLTLFCAKIVNNNTKESNHCIELVEKWLLDKNSVTSQELYTAADVSSAAWYVAYNNDTINDTTNNEAASYATWTAYYIDNTTSYASYAAYAAYAVANASAYAATTAGNIKDINLYLKTLLRTTKQYNTTNHNNQHYESILKEIIKEDIDKVTDTDYNMLIDLSQEYYNINPNITNKRIFIELLRREYE